MEKSVCLKTCSNCKNFKRYYILNVSLRFAPVDKGFCVIRKRCKGCVREVAQNESCELWQTNELQNLKHRYVAENVLQDVSEKLEAVRVLLSEDNGQNNSIDEL